MDVNVRESLTLQGTTRQRFESSFDGTIELYSAESFPHSPPLNTPFTPPKLHVWFDASQYDEHDVYRMQFGDFSSRFGVRHCAVTAASVASINQCFEWAFEAMAHYLARLQLLQRVPGLLVAASSADVVSVAGDSLSDRRMLATLCIDAGDLAGLYLTLLSNGAAGLAGSNWTFGRSSSSNNTHQLLQSPDLLSAAVLRCNAAAMPSDARDSATSTNRLSVIDPCDETMAWQRQSDLRMWEAFACPNSHSSAAAEQFAEQERADDIVSLLLDLKADPLALDSLYCTSALQLAWKPTTQRLLLRNGTCSIRAITINGSFIDG